MKLLAAALFVAISAAPSLAAGDCILDGCADRAPAPESSHGASSSYDSPSDSPRGGASGGRFDFYVLALSWSPSFCAGGGATRSRAQCATGANPGFVVHGLWPQYAYGYPSRCRGNGFLPFSVLAGLNGLYPDEGLARHEWRQHGLCSGKPPSGYFADVRMARDAVTIPPSLKAPREDKTLSPLDVQRLSRRQSAPAPRHDGRHLPARRVAGGAHLFFPGLARFRRLSPGRPPELCEPGCFRAGGTVKICGRPSRAARQICLLITDPCLWPRFQLLASASPFPP